MPKNFARSRRTGRVGDELQKQLARIIQSHIRDSGLGFITISLVDVSPDLGQARVFITHLSANINDTSDKEEILTMLNGNVAKFRYQLSKILTLRIVPKIQFIFDDGLERANRLTSLIHSLNTKQPDS